MTPGIFHARPMNVLVDRSRDRTGTNGALRLAPAAVFRITDSHVPLTPLALRRYDVLIVTGQSPGNVPAAEIRAVEAFVRRGGTLLLAANPGVFELSTGLPIRRMAADRLARAFGYAFESSAARPVDRDGWRGLPREEVSLTKAGEATGLVIEEITLAASGSLKTPRGATALLRAGTQAVMAWSRHGRGKVLVSADAAMFDSYNSWALARFVMLVEPQARVEAAPASKKDGFVPAVIPPIYHTRKGKHVTVHFIPAAAERVTHALKLAEDVYARLTAIVAPVKKLKTAEVYLEAGCTGWTEWPGEEYLESHIGHGAGDAMLAAMLIDHWAQQIISIRIGWEIRELAFWPVLVYVRIRILRELGFTQLADHYEAAASSGEEMPGIENLDLGRVYSEWVSPPGVRRLWLDIAQEFGDSALTRFCAGLPRKDSFKNVDFSLWSDLDVIAQGLARQYGTRVYQWMRERRWTVREMPLHPLDSEKFTTALAARLEELLADAATPTSVRYDALLNLASLIKPDKTPLDEIARRARGTTLAGFAAAAHLAATKDARARALLVPWLAHQDPAIAAVAALVAVFEAPDKTAADHLVELTPIQDTRFKLSAGYALGLMEDARADRFAFSALPECKMVKILDGRVKAFPFVEGYPVANVFSAPSPKPASRGAAFSQYYVEWVHTSPRWRRRGLARLGLAASLDYRWDSACSVTSLHTGTTNVAHALYRDFGLHDYYRNVRFEKGLGTTNGATTKPPKGVRIRAARPSEFGRIASFVQQDGLLRATDRRVTTSCEPDMHMFVAENGTGIVAAAGAKVRGEKAMMRFLTITAPKDRKGEPVKDGHELTGLALLAALHASLRNGKAKSVEIGFWSPAADKDLYWLLHRAGYGSAARGGVELFRINNLAQYLDETRTAMEHRLADHKTLKAWVGSIELEAAGRGARLDIDHARIRVQSLRTETRPAQPATLRITGPMPSMQRAVMGVRSCFEEYLQIELSAQPLVNGPVKDLLETLFPRIVAESMAG